MIIIIYSNVTMVPLMAYFTLALVWHLCFFALFLLHCVCICYHSCISSGVLVSLYLVHRRMAHARIYASDSE